MLSSTGTILDEGKKSLKLLIREKAYEEVVEKLAENDIATEDISDEDIEALVSAKVNDMMNGIKGFAAGGVFALLLSTILGF